MPGLPGDPVAIEAAANGLARAAQQLDEVRDAVAALGQELGGGPPGPASLAGMAAVEGAVGGTATLADVSAGIVGPLRVYADELRRAQLDWTEGERMALAGEAALDGVASGAPADAARDQGRMAMTDGVAVMDSAAERARIAREAAARALDEAARALARLTPAVPPVQDDGDLWDGLWKAGGDVVDEVGSTVSGLIDHVNVFDEHFGDTWSTTYETAAAAVADPVAAGTAIVAGTVEPLADSYRSGGVDEAIGRSPGVIASVLGGKGIPQLRRLTDLPVHGPDPRPSTPLAPGGGLQRHEDAGGHTLDPNKAHVGATDQQLLDRQARMRRPVAISSYDDRQTAERAIHDNITANRAAIEQWLRSNPTEAQPFEFPHGYPIGRSAPKNASGLDDVVDATRSRVVLQPDPTAPGGYYILTSYPRP